MKKWMVWAVLCCLLVGVCSCGQEGAREEGADSGENQNIIFDTLEEGIAYYRSDGGEVLYQDLIYHTDMALLYSPEEEYLLGLAFLETENGYVLMSKSEKWVIPIGGDLTISIEAPWEKSGSAGTPVYKYTCTGFEQKPTEEELAENGFREYMERNGRYFSVKLERYEMQPVLTNEVQIS